MGVADGVLVKSYALCDETGHVDEISHHGVCVFITKALCPDVAASARSMLSDEVRLCETARPGAHEPYGADAQGDAAQSTVVSPGYAPHDIYLARALHMYFASAIGLHVSHSS